MGASVPSRKHAGGSGWRGRLAFGLIAVIMSIVAVAGASTVAFAENAGNRIGLELNRLEKVGDGCRLSFIFRNGLSGTVEAMALELVLFDGEDRVAGLIAIDAGRLPAGKTRVRQFDFPATPCGGIARVLVNDVTACQGGGLAPGRCLEAIEVSSRAGIELVN
jgi:hypothetical protein